MVNSVRRLLPTDLPALVTHPGLSYANEACPRERLGCDESQPLSGRVGAVRDQMLGFAQRRGAWVIVRRQRLQGLVGARPRGGNEAWEIDYLVDATPDQGVTADLLEHAVAEAGKERAQKLFLRLTSESDLLKPAIEAGFVAYQEETLYECEGADRGEPASLRTSVASDAYPLFRLYCQAVPEAIRRVEAPTFEEWHAAQERRWLRNGRQFVLEQDGALRGLVRASRQPQGLMLDLLLDSETDPAGIVRGALAATESSDEPVLVLVPQAFDSLARWLEQAGFKVRQRYISLVRRTTRPLALPKKAPAIAKNAIGV